MPYVKTRDGTDIYVKDWGTGRPVILTHGWPLNADSWDAQAMALANAGFRAIAYDRRGFGRSGQPWTGYNYDTLTDDLADVMEATGANTDATIVGLSGLISLGNGWESVDVFNTLGQALHRDGQRNSVALLAALRAAGEHTRLRLLALLGRGELSVGELAGVLGQSQPRVSRHLKLLCDAGLLDRWISALADPAVGDPSHPLHAWAALAGGPAGDVVDHLGLSRALSAALAEDTADAALAVCRACVAWLPMTGASITVMDGAQGQESVCATGPGAARIDELVAAKVPGPSGGA